MSTITVGQAFADLAYVLKKGETVAIGDNSTGSMVTHSLHEVENEPIGANRYFSTGTFPVDTNWKIKNARAAINVKRLLCLPYDFDLKSFLNVPKRDLVECTNEELDTYKRILQETIEDVFRKIGLPIHRLDDTGYGLAVQVRVPPSDDQMIPEIRTLHKSTITRINTLMNMKLADTSVSDAGTRFLRLVPCENVFFDEDGTKLPSRPSKNVYVNMGAINEATLKAAAGPQKTWQGRPTPFIGKDLPEDLESDIVERLKPFWNQGVRHDIGLAFGGWMVKSDVSEEAAIRMVTRLADADRKPWDRVKSVQDSYHKYREGLEVKGYSSLKDIVDLETLEYLDRRLAVVKKATARSIRFASQETRTQPDLAEIGFKPIPATTRRGFIGNYIDLMSPTTEAPAAFHLGVGFTILGATLGRDVWADYGEPIYANLFALLVGKSGRTRKDTSIRRGTRFITDSHLVGGRLAGNPTKIIADVGSAEGLMTELSTSPNLLLYSTEFSKLMGNAKRKATGTIIPTLMQAWDAPLTMSTVTRGDPIEVSLPYLSVLAATQPEILANLMSDEDVASGFANRWLYVCGDPTNDPIPSPPPVDKLISREMYGELTARKNEGAQLVEGFRLTGGAEELWEDWYIQDFHHTSDTIEEDQMRPRRAPIARKLALIYAATEGTRSINAEQLKAAIDVVEWMTANVTPMIPTWGQNTFAKLERRILELLASAPNRRMRRRDLQRKCQTRTITAVDFGRAIDALEASDRVRSDPSKVYELMIDDQEGGESSDKSIA